MLLSAQIPVPLPSHSSESFLSIQIQNPPADSSNEAEMAQKKATESFSGTCKPTPLTQVRSLCFAQPETTSGQKSAYAKHDVPLIRPLEPSDEDLIMIKQQFLGKTKNEKGFGAVFP